MPRYQSDDDDFWIETVWETAKRLGRITYIDESIKYLPYREYLAITDVALPDSPVPKERSPMPTTDSVKTIDEIFAPRNDHYDELRQALRECVKAAWKDGHDAGWADSRRFAESHDHSGWDFAQTPNPYE